jgi:hypothetical protein
MMRFGKLNRCQFPQGDHTSLSIRPFPEGETVRFTAPDLLNAKGRLFSRSSSLSILISNDGRLQTSLFVVLDIGIWALQGWPRPQPGSDRAIQVAMVTRHLRHVLSRSTPHTSSSEADRLRLDDHRPLALDDSGACFVALGGLPPQLQNRTFPLWTWDFSFISFAQLTVHRNSKPTPHFVAACRSGRHGECFFDILAG